MRKTYMLIVLAGLLTCGCKKEFETINENRADARPGDIQAQKLCIEEHWSSASTYSTREVGMVYNNKLYVPDGPNDRVRIFDGNSWTSVPSPVPLTSAPPTSNHFSWVVFTLGDRGYLLQPFYAEGGFWEYNFAQNTWKRKADFPGVNRYNAAYFSIGTKGYVVGGWKNLDTYMSDTWQYNQSTDTWTQKAGIGDPGKAAATGFSIDNKGYIVCGRFLSGGNETYSRVLMRYDPSSNSWAYQAHLPGQVREQPSAFVIDDKAYVGGGGRHYFSTVFEDFYRYNPANNSWHDVVSLPGVYQMSTFYGFTLNSTGYCVTEFNDNNYIYKYNPQVCPSSSQ